MPSREVDREDQRLTRLAGICLALPEAKREDQGRHAAFLIRGRTFAYFLSDHHGDGMVSVACKALPGDNVRLAAARPKLFYVPPYIGPRGWVALRLDVGRVAWREVSELVATSYFQIAPKRLAALIERDFHTTRQKNSPEIVEGPKSGPSTSKT